MPPSFPGDHPSQDARAGADDASANQRARRIEEASLRAWPAHADTDFDNWRLRFADGYTKRANSITPLGRSNLPLEDKLATCERLYAERGLPAIFRLTPFAPEGLDEVLERRGYRRGELVQVRALSFARGATAAVPIASGEGGFAAEAHGGSNGTLPGFRTRPAKTPTRTRTAEMPDFASEPVRSRAHSIDRWLDIFGGLSGAPRGNQPAHRAVLNAVPGVRRLWALWVQGTPVACAMSVLWDGLLGVFDLVTASGQRNRGYGSALLHRTLVWGARLGAEEAYLQVLEGNAAAEHIYDRAGFEIVYRYHYRERI